MSSQWSCRTRMSPARRRLRIAFSTMSGIWRSWRRMTVRFIAPCRSASRSIRDRTPTSTIWSAALTTACTRPSGRVKIVTLINYTMRNRYLIANWKMNLPPETIGSYLKAVGAAAAGDVRVVVAPPFPYLRETSSQTRLDVAAQNCGDHDKGAFTGEVAPSMIADCGARFVIIGHSERRKVYGESDI